MVKHFTIPGGKANNGLLQIRNVGSRERDNWNCKEKFRERTRFYRLWVTDAATGIAHIVLAEEDNSIVVVQGANALVNESVVNRSKDLLIKADMASTRDSA